MNALLAYAFQEFIITRIIECICRGILSWLYARQVTNSLPNINKTFQTITLLLIHFRVIVGFLDSIIQFIGFFPLNIFANTHDDNSLP